VQTFPSAAETAGLALEVQKIVPGTQVIEVASGDLDGDGSADVTALVHGPAPDESFRIIVLHAQGTRFVEWARSANVGPFPKGLPALSIERGSIVFDTSAATCCERSTEHHQFQLRDGRFRLVGATVREASEGVREPRAMDDVLSEVDFNLLTGDRMEKLETRGRKTHSQKSRESVPTPRWLENFSGLLEDPDLARVLAVRLR
jgi:hypothetical protein